MVMVEEFFTDIHRRECVFNENIIIVEDIETCVESLLENLLKVISQKQPLFVGSKLVPGGSYYEGTKVRQPDEFDYMLVLKPPPFANSVEIEAGCSPWFKRIIVGCRCGYYDYRYPSWATGTIPKPNEFEKMLWECIKIIVEKEPITIETNHGIIRTREAADQKLYLEYCQKHTEGTFQNRTGPGLLKMHSVDIGVDLMLAYEHPNTCDVLKDIAFPEKYKTYLETNGCHLVAKSCKKFEVTGTSGRQCPCWFLSFSAAETEIMKELDVGHKQCYQVLKALLIGSADYPGKCMNLSSYMLKTAVMYHVHSDPICEEMKYGACIPQILRYLRNGFDEVNMPCFLSREQQIWGSHITAPQFVHGSFMHSDLLLKHDIYDETVYAMLWVEFWRRAIMVIENLFSTKSLLQSGERRQFLVEKLKNFRNLVSFCIKIYCKPITRGHIRGMDTVMDVTTSQFFKSIPSEVKSLFPKYISDWKDKIRSDWCNSPRDVKARDPNFSSEWIAAIECDWFDRLLEIDLVQHEEILYQRC